MNHGRIKVGKQVSKQNIQRLVALIGGRSAILAWGWSGKAIRVEAAALLARAALTIR